MTTSRHPAIRDWAWGVGVFVAAAAAFGHDLAGEPDFADEWAYVSQAYFWDELARPHSARWLEYPAFDLPPLPKYVIGAALRAAGYPLLPPEAARAWYRDIDRKFDPHAMLLAARRPSVVFGAIGCAAAFALGTMAFDRRVGLLAAGLLIVDPLYRMLARRAMSDIYAEGLILTTCALGLLAWKRLLAGRRPTAGWVALLGAAGVLGGLAVLAKLNGGLALLVLAGWSAIAARRGPLGIRRFLAVLTGTALAGAAAFATFVALNPFLTARPKVPLPAEMRRIAAMGSLGRCVQLVRHRLAVPRDQQRMFPHNALITPQEKIAVVAVQGFGRFGPLGRKRFDPARGTWWFDSTRRFDWHQDAGAILWLPLVAAGAVVYRRRGVRQDQRGDPPTARAVLLQAGVTLLIVTIYLPLAWDRFFLSIQAASCLLASGAIVAAWDRLMAHRAGRAVPP
jgi:hypothetical protein